MNYNYEIKVTVPEEVSQEEAMKSIQEMAESMERFCKAKGEYKQEGKTGIKHKNGVKLYIVPKERAKHGV